MARAKHLAKIASQVAKPTGWWSSIDIVILTSVGKNEPPLGQEFLDVSVAQGEAQKKPDRMLDDRRRKAVPAIGDLARELILLS